MDKSISIKKGNAIIAAFVGNSAEKKNDKELFFHSSWDWLMPAWRKFFKTACQHKYSSNDQTEEVMNYRLQFHCAVDEGDPEKAFTILVKGVQWYNKRLNHL